MRRAIRSCFDLSGSRLQFVTNPAGLRRTSFVGGVGSCSSARLVPEKNASISQVLEIFGGARVRYHTLILLVFFVISVPTHGLTHTIA